MASKRHALGFMLLCGLYLDRLRIYMHSKVHQLINHDCSLNGLLLNILM